MNNPKEIIEANMNGAVNKANLPLARMIILGMMAGMFIALGGAISNTAVHDIANVGLARTLAGVIFPVGLLMIILVGGELFTGNCLMVMAAMNKRIKVSGLIRNLVIVYFSNLIGSLIIDVLIFYSGNLDYTGGALGAYTIKVALGKVNITPGKAVVSGILCNFLVCMAILMAGSAKDVIGKIFATWFPIFAFVIGGFEHIVANMFYIPTGILAATNPDYVAKAEELYGITADQLSALDLGGLLHNFIPVTIGNILGGMIFIGCTLYFIHYGSEKK
ncbi:MAG: formate/nitrite transporter family protein [Lachnospiraceae bacterium]|nr:formate/nitrite transporter family protein [Lachnospiraceae bacterium]